MQLFYSNQINDDVIILSEDEAKHCIKSIRKEVGDEIRVVDGNGNLYITELIATDKKICKLRVKEINKELGKRNNYVHIVIAPTKNLSRIEWFVEKAIEIGVTDAELYSELGLILTDVGGLENAVECFNHAIILGSRDKEVFLKLGLIYEAQNNPIAAIVVYERATKFDKNDPRINHRLNTLLQQESNASV